MAGRKSDFTLTRLDDLFSTQEQRDEEKLSKIRDIPLELIDDFPDHPFKVRDDEDMQQLVESIKERGVITPATVRQKEDGRYELISGHRRKRASELAGFDTLRCEVVDLNRDEATILMVESNFQRSQILPSEKAYVKSIFNNDYTELTLKDGRTVGYKTFQNVLHLWEGSYNNRTAQSYYDWGVIAQHFEAMRLLGELSDEIKPLPSTDSQLSLIESSQAEEQKSSAFSFSQEIIDAVLTRGSGVSEGKMRIYEQFEKSLSAKENADFLKNEYGWGGSYPVIIGAGIDENHDGKGITLSKGFGNGAPKLTLKWNQVEKRIGELIRMDRYLNPKEKEQYPKWLEKQEERRAELAEQQRNREILSSAPPETENNDVETEARYEYHLGDTVYIGASEYEILSFDDERVMLLDRATGANAIVQDMWLTGFDVPSLATMYVYKPMSGHNLMQAIARVNRVFRDKEGGLVVDYVGIATALKKAMNDYTARDKKNYGDTDVAKVAFPKFQDKDAMTQLVEERERLQGLLKSIRDSIENIKSEYPYTMKEILEDTAKTEQKKQELEGILEQYNELISIYKAKIEEMLR